MRNGGLSNHCATPYNEVVVDEFPNMVWSFPPFAGLEKVMSTYSTIITSV
jgi:hypothetical protein